MPNRKGLPPQIWGPQPKTVWGHNLQHMAPFGALTSGFCMVFDSPTLTFLTPDPIFGAPNPRGRPWEARGPFWAQKGGPKNITLWRDWSPTRFPQIFCEGNGLYGTQEPFGCTNFPPNPPREGFYRDFPQTRKFQGGPWAPGWVAYCPFVGHWPIQLPINPPAWACTCTMRWMILVGCMLSLVVPLTPRDCPEIRGHHRLVEGP